MTDKPPSPYGTPGRARATLSQIRAMRGRQALDESVPDRVIRIGMFGQREVWEKISGHVPAIYELQDGGE